MLHRCIIQCVSVLLLLGTHSLGSRLLSASEFDIASLQQRIHSTIQDVQPAVVAVRQRGGTFSGVIVSRKGEVLSAGHAVEPGAKYQVLLPDGRRFSAVGKGSNPQADCALLQITDEVADLPFVRMGDSASLVRNQPCLSLSYPGGQGVAGVPMVRFGRIVRVNGSQSMMQSTALMEPGDSGGPLFDLQGRVIGIHSRIGRSMSRNLEVPIDTFKKYWNELHREATFTQSGPTVPKLGIRGNSSEDGAGIQIEAVVDGSLASEHGLEKDDLIEAINDQPTPSIENLREALIAARDDDNINELVLQIRRDEEEVTLKIPFEIQRDEAPEVALPEYEDRDYSEPQAIEELVRLPDFLAELESRLDDACIEIISTTPDGEELKICGTLIRGTPLILSKSSMVQEEPKMVKGETKIELTILTRDAENDLILLQSPESSETGIDLTAASPDLPNAGSFLITPEAGGNGWVSVVSSPTFASRKQQSRGYLGVIPEDYKNRGGAILKEVTPGGAADQAGLQAGDIVTKLNETAITRHMEMREFLGTVDPNTTIVATVTRGEEELEIAITLGVFPTNSNHVADQMRKSGRRDGFEQVFSHDADLRPEECGGPLFDLAGNFLGLNIARNSRVRSYAITPEILQAWVEKNGEAIK
jgi:serine protease Do